MRKVVLILLQCFAIMISCFAENEVACKTTINDVTIYKKGAMVERSGTVHDVS